MPKKLQHPNRVRPDSKVLAKRKRVRKHLERQSRTIR